MRWTIGKKIWAGFGIALVFVIILGVNSFRNTNILIRNDEMVNHTHKVLQGLENIISMLKDGEVGQRGYLITGVEAYLEPYTAALEAVKQETSAIRTLTSDNPGQQRRLDIIEPLIGDKFAELKETIDLRRSKGFEAALAVVLTNKGKAIMDKMLGVLDQMKNEELDLLETRAAESKSSAAKTKLFLVLGTALAVVLAVVLGYFISKTITTPIIKLKDAAVDISQGNMDAKIDVGLGDEIGELAEAFDTMRTSLKVVMEEYEKKEKEE